MIIRPAQRSDLAAITALQRDSIWELARSAYGDAGAAAWARWQVQTTESLLDGAGALLVAQDEIGLAGMGGWAPDVADNKCAWIRAVFVAPRSTRRGVGQRLMAEVEEAARQANRTLFRLTASFNALEFYSAQGYSVTAPKEWEVEPGVVLNCVDMQKTTRLAPS